MEVVLIKSGARTNSLALASIQGFLQSGNVSLHIQVGDYQSEHSFITGCTLVLPGFFLSLFFNGIRFRAVQLN